MLSKQEKQLLIIQFLFFFVNSLASLFLQIFIFNLGGLGKLILFNLVQYVVLLAVYVISGRFLKTYSTRTLIRISLIISAFTWGLLFALKTNAQNHLILIANLFGIVQGAYWSGFNLSQYILTHKKTRESYFGKGNFLVNVASGFGPFIGGYIILFGSSAIQIPLSGYYLLFSVVAFLSVFTIFFVKELPRHSSLQFSYKDIFKSNKNKL